MANKPGTKKKLSPEDLAREAALGEEVSAKCRAFNALRSKGEGTPGPICVASVEGKKYRRTVFFSHPREMNSGWIRLYVISFRDVPLSPSATEKIPDVMDRKMIFARGFDNALSQVLSVMRSVP